MFDAMDETALLQAMKASAAQSMRRHVELGWATDTVRPDVKLRGEVKSARRLEALFILADHGGWMTCPDVNEIVQANVSDTARRLLKLYRLGLVERKPINVGNGFASARFAYRITDKGREALNHGGHDV